jgi:hypothetical protein
LALNSSGPVTAGTPHAVVRDVLPHPLVGVELRGVGGQHEQLESAVGGGDEVLHGLRAVGGVAVDDQVDRAVGVGEQLAAELDEPGAGEAAGNPKSGRGVVRSLPAPALNSRNSAVITAQTV